MAARWHLLLSLTKSDVHRVAKTLTNLLTYILTHAYYVARCAHAHYLPIIRFAIERGMHRHTTLAKQCLYVKWDFHISGIHRVVLNDDGIKLQQFHT